MILFEKHDTFSKFDTDKLLTRSIHEHDKIRKNMILTMIPITTHHFNQTHTK